MSHEMRDTCNRGLLEYAVSRVLFCPSCGKLLDSRTAVLLDVQNREGVRSGMRLYCAPCWDRAESDIRAVMAKHDATLEVTDGRTLYSPPASKDPHHKPVRNVRRANEVKIGGVYKVKIGQLVVDVRVDGTYRPTQYSFDTKRRPLKFEGTNLKTRRRVRFGAAKIRGIVSEPTTTENA